MAVLEAAVHFLVQVLHFIRFLGCVFRTLVFNWISAFDDISDYLSLVCPPVCTRFGASQLSQPTSDWWPLFMFMDRVLSDTISQIISW